LTANVRGKAEEMQVMNEYERRALAEIERWKNREPTSLRKALAAVGKPFDVAASWAMETAVGETVSKAVQGVVSMVNDLASWTVRADQVYADFHKHGHTHVASGPSIRTLSLEDVDKVVGRLSLKYKSLAAAEGGVAGAFGIWGLAADIPALAGIALRSVAEYATYYGYCVDTEAERRVILEVLGAAAAPTTAAAKRAAMAQVAKAAAMAGRRVAWRELEKLAVVSTMK
jgi:hypothetical protein